QQSLERYVHPKIGNLPVANVDLACVLSVLEPIWTIIPESARRIRNRIELVLDWATARKLRQGDNPARWKGLLESLLPEKKPNGVAHLPAMKYADVPSFMVRLRNEQGFAARALELQILTGVRPGQACGGRWSEVKEGTWIIPPERAKNGREHRVPLSQEAVELLANLPRIVGSEYVFPAPRGGPMHAREALRVLHRLCPANVVSHGFRSAFSDWAHECTAYAPHVIEQALGHVVLICSSSAAVSCSNGANIAAGRASKPTWCHCGRSVKRSPAPIGRAMTNKRERFLEEWWRAAMPSGTTAAQEEYYKEWWKIHRPQILQEALIEFREAYLGRAETGELAAYIEAILKLGGVLMYLEEPLGLSESY